MNILSLDTSTALGGVALLRDDQVLSSMTWEREGSHGEHLTPNIELCLQQANLKASAIDVIVLGCGPGSFTGVRIAVNAARSLAFALNKPVVTFDTTEILAFGVKRHDLPLLVLVNAHKNLLYSSTFRFDPHTGLWNRSLSLEARSIEQIGHEITAPHLCVGDGFEEYKEVFSPLLQTQLARNASFADVPHPVELGLLYWKARDFAQPLAWKEVQALYIRASGAEEKLRESREKSSKS